MEWLNDLLEAAESGFKLRWSSSRMLAPICGLREEYADTWAMVERVMVIKEIPEMAWVT